MVAPRFESPPSTRSSPSRSAIAWATAPFWIGSSVPPGPTSPDNLGATSIAS